MDIFYTKNGDETSTILSLNPTDFQNMLDDDVLETRGHRFEFCIIPKDFEQYFKQEPTFQKLRGTLMVGSELRAEILTY